MYQTGYDLSISTVFKAIICVEFFAISRNLLNLYNYVAWRSYPF